MKDLVAWVVMFVVIAVAVAIIFRVKTIRTWVTGAA